MAVLLDEEWEAAWAMELVFVKAQVSALRWGELSGEALEAELGCGSVWSLGHWSAAESARDLAEAMAQVLASRLGGEMEGESVKPRAWGWASMLEGE